MKSPVSKYHQKHGNNNNNSPLNDNDIDSSHNNNISDNYDFNCNNNKSNNNYYAETRVFWLRKTKQQAKIKGRHIIQTKNVNTIENNPQKNDEETKM